LVVLLLPILFSSKRSTSRLLGYIRLHARSTAPSVTWPSPSLPQRCWTVYQRPRFSSEDRSRQNCSDGRMPTYHFTERHWLNVTITWQPSCSRSGPWRRLASLWNSLWWLDYDLSKSAPNIDSFKINTGCRADGKARFRRPVFTVRVHGTRTRAGGVSMQVCFFPPMLLSTAVNTARVNDRPRTFVRTDMYTVEWDPRWTRQAVNTGSVNSEIIDATLPEHTISILNVKNMHAMREMYICS